MKYIARLIAAAVASLYLAAIVCNAEVIGIWFSPNGGATSAIVKHIDNAKSEIQWQAYNLTSPTIADALKRAQKRGVKVTVICDFKASRQASSKVDELAKSGCAVYLDSKHAIAHDKTRIFDGQVVLAGSFNDSVGAEIRNGETLFAFDDAEEIQKCRENFAKHLQHSKRLKGAP